MFMAFSTQPGLANTPSRTTALLRAFLCVAATLSVSCVDGIVGDGSSSTPLISGPAPCSSADPNCSLSVDYPDSADLTASNSSNIAYDVGTGALELVGSAGGAPLADSDSDGVPDLVDDCPGAGFRIPCDSTDDDGIYNELPFGGSVEVTPGTYSVSLSKADVYILMDVTGSMSGEIANLKSSLISGTLDASCATGVGGGVLGAILCSIDDTQFGVGFYRDFPVSSVGGSSDAPYHHILDITDNFGELQTAVDTLRHSGGADWPESQTQALYAVATGRGLGKYLPNRIPCAGSRWGYPCFRSDAVPIIVMVTDATFHNGPGGNNYSLSLTLSGVPALVPPAMPVSLSPETFAAPFVVPTSLAGSSITLMGATNHLNNDVSYGCGSGARDAVIQFDSGAGNTTVSTHYSDYDTNIGVFSNPSTLLNCNDDASGGPWAYTSSVTNVFNGTHYAVVDGYSSSSGAYRLVIDNGGGYELTDPAPVSWLQTVVALQAANMRVITATTCGADSGSCALVHDDARALGLATSTTDAAGFPYVYTASSNGTGLGTSLVDGVDDLANESRFDVSLVPVDNPSTAFDETVFVDSLSFSSCPAVGCFPGLVSGECTGCASGTTVTYNISLLNNSVMPIATPQVFEFEVHVRLNGTTQRVIPMTVVVPATNSGYMSPGWYQRDYDATLRCEFPSHAAYWSPFTFTAVTPSDSSIVFQFWAGNTPAELTAATPVSVTVPPGTSPIDVGAVLQAGGLRPDGPFVRVRANLQPSSDLANTPSLYGFEMRHDCRPVD